EVRGKIGRKYHDAVEALELAQQYVHDRVGLALHRLQVRRRATRGYRIGLVEEEHRALLVGDTKHRCDVLGRFAGPHRLHLRIAYDEKPSPQRLRDGLRADRLSRSRRTRKVEGEPESGRVTLAQPPPAEDEVVVAHLRERLFQSLARLGRKNYVREGTYRRDNVHGAALGGARNYAEEFKQRCGHRYSVMK